MPKNGFNILKEIAAPELSKSFDVKFSDSIQDFHFKTDVEMKTYEFFYGKADVLIQYIPVPDWITVIIFEKPSDINPLYSRLIDAPTYKERKAKIKKLCEIFIDGVYDGCNIDVVIEAIRNL